MNQIIKHTCLFILIYILEIGIAYSQKYKFDLGLKQDSLTARNLKLKETVAVNGNDTIRHYIYNEQGNLKYQLEFDKFTRVKTIKVFDAKYYHKKTIQIEKGIILDSILFNDNSRLTYYYQPDKEHPLHFKATEQQKTLFPDISKLEPFLKRYNAFEYSYREINEYEDTVKVMVNSIYRKYYDFTLSVKKIYGLCLDSSNFEELYTFDKNRINAYRKTVKRYTTEYHKPKYLNETRFENNELESIKEEDFRQNRHTLFEFNLDSFPQIEYTFFDTCNSDIPKEKLYFNKKNEYVKRIIFKNYYAQYNLNCLCWNAIHYDSSGKKIKKEKFLRDNYYFYKDSLWFDINKPFKNPRTYFDNRGTCGGGGSRNNFAYVLNQGIIFVEDYYSTSNGIILDSISFLNFKQNIENNIHYPAVRLDAEIQWTDSLLITANKSLTKIYNVECNPSYGKIDNSVPFLMKRFEYLHPLQNFTSVIITLQNGKKKVLNPTKDDSRITFNINIVYRIKRE